MNPCALDTCVFRNPPDVLVKLMAVQRYALLGQPDVALASCQLALNFREDRQADADTALLVALPATDEDRARLPVDIVRGQSK